MNAIVRFCEVMVNCGNIALALSMVFNIAIGYFLIRKEKTIDDLHKTTNDLSSALNQNNNYLIKVSEMISQVTNQLQILLISNNRN